jgi:hypothetical protein
MDQSDNQPLSIDEWNGSYSKRLAPCLGISVVLHGILIGILFVMSLMDAGGRGLIVTQFDPGVPGAGMGSSPLIAGFDALDRMKIFRIDFFREIIPWSPPPPPEPEIIEEEPEEPLIEEPEIIEPEIEEEPIIEEEPVEEVIEEPLVVDDSSAPPLIGDPGELFGGFNSPVDDNDLLVTPPGIERNIPRIPSDDEILPDSLYLYKADGDGFGGLNVLSLPEWELPGLGNLAWKNEYFLNNYTIYLVGDISRRHGFDELLAWNYVIRMLLTNPQAAFPPNVVTVGVAMENPYAFNNTRILNLLTDASEDENAIGVMIADSDGLFAKSLGYSELVQPFVVFVDNNGFVRLIMQGRVKDISSESMDSTMEVIAEMWQWDETEMGILPTVVMLLINLLRDQAYDPEERMVAPAESAYEIAPAWGYPEFVPETTYVRPDDEDYVHF